MQKYPITHSGWQKLLEELKDMKDVQRPSIIAAVTHARELGDLRENAEYHAAKDRQGYIEARIVYLEDIKARGEVMDVSAFAEDTVKFGAKIHLKNLDNEKVINVQIVSEYECDASSGKISNESPIAKAVLGKRLGDIVEVESPQSKVEYEVMKIKY